MRKFILIAALVLVSATANAGAQLAAIDSSTDTKTTVTTDAPKAAAPAEQTVKSEDTQSSRPVEKPQVRKHESQEAKARRIAARYGVYW
jgi:hypothetical protein